MVSDSITFEWPELPPSVNNLYFSRGGRRILGGPGRKFKQAFVTQRGGLTARELMAFRPDNEQPYALEMHFYLRPEQLYNKGYGKSKATKSPFKKLDTSNLVKLLEDSIAELLGLRDRNNFTVIAHKREGFDDFYGCIARLTPLDLENDPYGHH
jgi:hypothetical protein